MFDLLKIGKAVGRALCAIGLVVLPVASSFGVVSIVDTGFEQPAFAPSTALDGQGGWVSYAGDSTATVKAMVGKSSTQGVEVSRAAYDDAYWLVPSTYPSGYPSSSSNYLNISWDMNVSRATTWETAYGPFFGVVGCQDTGSAVTWFGAFGVDGANGQLMYSRHTSNTTTNGELVPVKVGDTPQMVNLGEWHNYKIRLDLQTSTYDLYLDNVGVLANLPFVDSGMTCLTDADIMATFSDKSSGGYAATGTAYFDNFKVTEVPEPSTLVLCAAGLLALALGAIRRCR